MQVERYKTGGGKYSTTMSGVSEQVLGIIGDRIEPLVNPYDDDISYTGLILTIILICIDKIVNISFVK